MNFGRFVLAQFRAIQNITGTTAVRMSSTFNKANFYADSKAPIVSLSAKDFFHQLTDTEQKYAHYFSKASHYGSRIVLRQVSHESEGIFDLILQIHGNLNGDYSKLTVSETVLSHYLEYSAQFLSNLGNYKSFGDTKFIPKLSIEEFKLIVEQSKADLNLFHSVASEIFEIDAKTALLGFPSEGHKSSYYIGNVNKNDMVVLKKVLGKHKIYFENVRIQKVSENEFKILIASRSKTNTLNYPQEINEEGVKVTFEFGDHSKEFSKIIDALTNAKNYAANETQIKMIDAYIKSFDNGSIEDHKESQKYWVKDLSPVIETNIGFIETYREPSGVIGEWEGLVSIQNKERTKKFQNLVNNAESFINLLPWSKEFEKDKFQAPDFTSLEVLTFAGSGIPAGINIPNYDDIRLTVGFKNVSLGNILNSKSSNEPITFINHEKDFEVFNKYRNDSFEVQVGIHELLGHGSGKLLSQLDDGSFNFDNENPPLGLDNKPIKTYYKKGEYWGSKFGSLAGAYEECRAEVIALYLITNESLLKIFGFDSKTDQENIIYSAFLQMSRAGLLALEFWDPATAKWGQPHMQARFSILKTLLNSGLVKLVYKEADYSDLYVELNKQEIETVGHEAIKDYLRHLHIYKSSGDAENGSKYFIDRSTVTPELAKFRDIVLKSRLPRKQYIQANTEIDETGEVVLKEYPENEIGLIQSFYERGL